LEWSQAFALDFEPPDLDTFGCLRLAIEAGIAGGTAPAVLNAANEMAVDAFLHAQIGFLDIEALVADALDHVAVRRLDALETVLDADRAARARVSERIGAGS
jgi:1-deoxy-D-xylulose-5-phosphate reductoisomerase